jgi:tetratricopeptide (TPR) repeat protein/predicted Ser/Thr protein kinase
MIGETVSHYRIIEQLGEGGMGVVYRAEDINLGRPVAIKFLTSTAPALRARFLREAQAVSLLHHQNIAAVFDYGETPKGQPYIVMELIKGEPLSEKLRGGSLPLPEAARMVCSIAEALGEAHFQGVVHRDIKPSNVIINERGQVKVVDFGLVKQIFEAPSEDADDKRAVPVGAHTRSDVIVGTPLYLSPEQATGKTVDGRSDLFALGAVLYECLTGASAFSGGSVIEIGAQIIHVNPPLPSKLNDHVPPELDRITMKAMEKEIEARYQSAAELIADLSAVIPSLEADGFRKRVRSTQPGSRARTHSASALTTLAETFRQPRLSWGAVLIGFLILVFIAGAWFWWRRPVRYRPAPVALDWFNKGTEALRTGEFLQASRMLEESVAADPQFALAHARLAEAWFELDDAGKAITETLNVERLVPNRSELTRVDALYLDAINATATRDFPGAISAYNKIVRLAPNEPYLYVDLGRAYEKNDQLKPGIESYETAIAREPQNPTPYLRVGVLYGDRLEVAKAMESFDKAQALFEALGKFEGQAEVAFQRGYLLYKHDKLAEAKPYLEQALSLAKTTRNPYQEVKTTLVLGNVYVDERDYPRGRDLIQQAIEKARASSIDRYVKRGLVDLGNSFFRAGEYQTSEKYFRDSLDLSRNQKDNRNSARALLSLASILSKQSKVAEASQYLEQALPFYQMAGYRKEAMQAFNLWARLKQQQGDYPAALQASEQHLNMAEQMDDSLQVWSARTDIGLLLAHQSKYKEALQQHEKAWVIAGTLGSVKLEVLCLINRTNATWALGQYEEARKLLTEAAPLAERSGVRKDMAWLLLAGARMALSERNWPEAIAKAQRALETAGTESKNLAAEATHTLGLAHVFAGSLSQGRLECEAAERIARESTEPALISNAQFALAQAYLQTGNSTEALKAALGSAETFSRLGTLDYEWISWLIAARASQSAGQTQKALEYAARAESILGQLQQKWGSDNYNSYLNRRDIQFYRKWLSEFPLSKP